MNFVLAAREVAVLMRRRDVDEKRETDKPLPTIKHQLAAMLPPEAHGLIDEVIRLSAKHSGEDPVWMRGHSLDVELGTVQREPSRDLGAPSRELSPPSTELRVMMNPCCAPVPGGPRSGPLTARSHCTN